MADYVIPKLVDRRLRYFYQQFLQEQDFIDEQAYHVSRQRLHNRALHTEGVVEGLTVTALELATQVHVTAGAALDGEGRMIVLTDEIDVPLNDAEKGKTVFLVISYPKDEVPDHLAAIGHTRWHEKPTIQFVSEDEAPPESTHIRLKKLDINAQGKISQVYEDEGIVKKAGANPGNEVVLTKLTVKTIDVVPDQCPVIYSGERGRVDVEGDLHVTGALKIHRRLILRGVEDCRVGTPTRIKKPFDVAPDSKFPILHIEAETDLANASFYWFVGRFNNGPAVFLYAFEPPGASSVKITYRVYEVGIVGLD